MTSITVLDTETTGLDPTDKIVEIALVNNDHHRSYMVNPGVPIKFNAMAAHHIRNEDVMSLGPWEDIEEDVLANCCDVICAHHAKYDRQYLPKELTDKKWICTYRCALSLWPDAESHKNMSLLYEYIGGPQNIKPPLPPEAGLLPHRALYDAWVTRSLLNKMLDEVGDVQKLIDITYNPILLKKVGFGKHHGTLWADVPKGYLRWVQTQDFDVDVRYTARRYLEGM